MMNMQQYLNVKKKIGRQFSLSSSQITICLLILVVVILFHQLFNLNIANADTRNVPQGDALESIVVGYKVPETFWLQEHLFYHNGDTIRKTLEEFKGMYLVVDFWNTTCAPCLKGFPDLQYYQNKYPEIFQVIKVSSMVKSGDDFDKIDAFYYSERLRKVGIRDFKTIILDEQLIRYFPHKGYPHYVCINHTGTVETISYQNLFAKEFWDKKFKSLNNLIKR